MERVMATYLRARIPLESDPLQQLVDPVLGMSFVCSTSLLTSVFPELRSELDSAPQMAIHQGDAANRASQRLGRV